MTLSPSQALNKYRDFLYGISELILIKCLLKELKANVETPIKLMCNNEHAMCCTSLVKHNHIKHVDIDQHFIKKKMESKLVYDNMHL